ncbi:GNAT family N-acetyltransferase [Candidatus Bealeia paramacronuclearis]|uniref:GNAT family N-acetyltransferase n=1 Tax=Candidatus Bealeia paramacronuclearis TaxID=1921001 RepID=UPI0039C491E4
MLDEFQGRGIGKSFFKGCRKWFLKSHKIHFIIWVFKDNVNAQKFYESEGGVFLTQDVSSIRSQEYIENCFIFSLALIL